MSVARISRTNTRHEHCVRATRDIHRGDGAAPIAIAHLEEDGLAIWEHFGQVVGQLPGHCIDGADCLPFCAACGLYSRDREQTGGARECSVDVSVRPPRISVTNAHGVREHRRRTSGERRDHELALGQEADLHAVG
jgi:hypothetical protein